MGFAGSANNGCLHDRNDRMHFKHDELIRMVQGAERHSTVGEVELSSKSKPFNVLDFMEGGKAGQHSQAQGEPGSGTV